MEFSKEEVLSSLRDRVIPELCELFLGESKITSDTWFQYPRDEVLTVREKPIVFEMCKDDQGNEVLNAFFSTPLILEMPDPQLIKQLGQKIMGELMLKF